MRDNAAAQLAKLEAMPRREELPPLEAKVAEAKANLDDKLKLFERAKREMESGIGAGETFDTGVCLMAFFSDPDGNAIMLHRRYAPPDA